MKSASRMKQWLLLLLCVVMTAGVMVQSAGAAEPTKKCTNLVNEGVEYFSKITVMGSDVTKWRQNLEVYAILQDDPTKTPVGSVVGMDVEVTNDDTRYSCTINWVGADAKTKMSCNSIPVNAIINGVYFIYQPGSMTPVDTPITFMVEQETFDPKQPGAGLHGTNAKVQLPPFPCARNLVPRNFEALKDQSLVLYTDEGCETVGTPSCESGYTLSCKTPVYVCSSGLVCQATGKSGVCPKDSKCLDIKITEEAVPSSGKCDSPKICKDTGKSGDCSSGSKCIVTSSVVHDPTLDSCSEYVCKKGTEEKSPKMNYSTISDQVLFFEEKYEYKNKYAIVNLMQGDHLDKDRVRISVSPEEEFDYVLTLTFGYDYDAATDTYGSTANVVYTYDPNSNPKGQVNASDLDGLETKDLPLVLLGGNISQVNANERLKPDWAGNVPFPTSVNFDVRFWYENETGTLGYENSVFHFIRNLNFKFASTCASTAISPALYDFCQSTRQGFYSTFPTAVTVYDGTKQEDKYLYYSTYEKTDVTHKFNLGKEPNIKSPKAVPYNKNYEGIFKYQSDPLWDSSAGSWKGRKAEFIFWFMTWKCVDAACDWTTSTSAYPYQLTMSDGGGASRTFTYRGGGSGSSSMTYYVMTPYYDTGRPYAIKGVNFVADEPGTYVIYTFMDYNERNKTAPANYYNKIYVTVNETDELLTCSTLANNGYFQAWWNDCLSPSETQLIRFEHIKGTEEAWVRNRSNHDVSFPFVAEYSYLPQKLEVASLNCYFEQIDGQGNPGAGYCSHYNVFVPAHTKVTITGGTMYMSGYPEYDEYRAAYMREDTMNISHLIFHINVEECKNKKIPDTGLSLRSPMSPLKVNEKVSASADPATGFVFTGNSLRIPAIGLGMETPIPIVHVYYENGTDNMVWDLSTLGNYVGELEGGSYIPYAGNSVLTGHFWSGGVFKNLEGLNYEDEIIIFANDGFKYTYSVVQKFIAQPEEVYEMFQQIGDRSLTLVTCENYNLVTNEYERRYIVRASIKNVEPYVENW